MSIIVTQDRDEVITKLTQLLAHTANESIQKNGAFYLGVSGGSVASFLTLGLPKITTDFEKWKIFFCDERMVPIENPDSTFGFYKKHLIGAGNIELKESNFVQVIQGVTPEEAADDYAQKIAECFPNATPKFDMLLLGMGPDGHTCSLFPGHPLTEEKDKLVAAIVDSPKPPPERVTLTFKVINNARNCVFAMCGKEKADMVKRILVDKEDLPSTRVKPVGGNLYWIVDKDAGQYL
ncbi:6-phosphogluconolactonase [Aethina tumida]|uniref:6-phosphogluconolactonase n=1 Tax=Aethina tumida TaxID=116153 RepID=UPI00214762C4|nr:6-phosphogluconolactonase [Aethina tumida]